MIEAPMHLLDMQLKVRMGLSACADCLCDEYPYKEFDHPDYKIQCIHKLIEDINTLRKEKFIIQFDFN